MKLSRYLVAIALSLFTLTQTAQAAEEPPWYDIELILFKQGSAVSRATENWPEDPGSPDWSEMVTLLPPAPADNPLQAYVLLPGSSHQLSAQFNALQRTRGAMEPLFHQAWRQPVETGKRAEPIYLGPDLNRSGNFPPPPFEGLIKISVSRYLHVELDILLNGANNTLAPVTPDGPASVTRGSIRFQASRRMRSGELHYIDHPRMGALIQISRVELPKPEPEPESPPPAEPETTGSGDPAPSVSDQVPARPATGPVAN